MKNAGTSATNTCSEANTSLPRFWKLEPNQEKSIDKVKEELADVLSYCYLMADHYHLDVDEILNKKLDQNEAKYPADKVRGSSKKYNEYKK